MNETPMNSCPFLSLVINQFTFTFQKPLIRTGFWTEVHPHLLHPLSPVWSCLLFQCLSGSPPEAKSKSVSECVHKGAVFNKQ